jgi:hypothetical protein
MSFQVKTPAQTGGGGNGGGGGDTTYVFDKFISPTGDDNTGDGSLQNPWSSSAIGTKQWSVLGCLPGTYTRSTVTGNYNACINLNQNLMGAHSLQSSGLTIASCDSTGHYSPRTAIFDFGSATPNQYTGHINPIIDAAVIACPNSISNITIDALVFKNFSQGLGMGNGNNNVVLNCDIMHGYCNRQPANTSACSFGGGTGGANGGLIYNTYIHHMRAGHQIQIQVTNITTTGAQLVSVNGVNVTAAGNNDGWPFMTGHLVGVRFNDTGQSFANATGTRGSLNLTWTLASVTGTPSGAATIQTQNVAPTGNASPLPLYFPWGMWGFYAEGVGLITPFTVEGCTFVGSAWSGNKTSSPQIHWIRTYMEQLNFNGPDPPGLSVTSYIAGFWNNSTTRSTIIDHCIICGSASAFGQGAVNDNWDAQNITNILAGTLTLDHVTFYSPPQTVAGATNTYGANIAIGLSQLHGPATLNNTNNIWASAINVSGYNLWYPSAVFTASINGTAMTLTAGANGILATQMLITGTGVAAGTTVVSGSGLNWQVTPSQTVASTSMNSAYHATPDWGTYTGDYNYFCMDGVFKRGTGGAGPAVAGGGLVPVNLADWRVLYPGQDVHSQMQTGFNTPGMPFANLPAQGNAASFALNPSHAAATASATGGPVGAIDGTVGRNGVACGCNFWYPDPQPSLM